MIDNNHAFFDLVRLGIGTEAVSVFQFFDKRSGTAERQDSIDWSAVKNLAEQQGLSAVVLDGIDKLTEQQRPPKIFLLEWIGETLQGFEYRYDQYRKTIAELAGFYNSHDYKMMVLKGYACSLNWPKPEHRPVGDIDIWQFGQQKEADAALSKERGIEIDASHHHHTVFYWGDFMVENHYDFINVHHHKGNVELEKEFKQLAVDDTHFVDVNGEKVYLPSPNLHALFLIKHAMTDFTSFSVSLRQILDWAFHVKKYGEKIDWDWLKKVLVQCHMIDFFNIINSICVEELGYSASIFHGVQFNPMVKDKVLNDILYPKFSMNEPASLIPRLIYKYKRWKGNGWKHEMCYNESMSDAFWSGIKNHLRKPRTI